MTPEAYLQGFERKIIVPAYQNGLLNSKAQEKDLAVPLKGGKLSKTEFGQFIGSVFPWDGLLAINYYGLFKLSTGIADRAKRAENIFAGIKSVISPVAHFNAIKVEHIKALAPELLDQFPDFKAHLVKLRWGK